MITTIHSKETTQRKPHAERAMALLETELLAMERGEEPNHERIQRSLLEISDRPPSRSATAVRGLCERLCMYLRDIRQDEMELSLEDLDVLLSNWAELDELVFNRQRPEDQEEVETPASPPDDQPMDVTSAPEFRDSGLLVESFSDGARIILPSMDDSRVTAKVLADISELWELTPQAMTWNIELSRSERIPVSLLSHFVGLNRAQEGRDRPVQLRGLETVESGHLTACLQRCFDLAH